MKPESIKIKGDWSEVVDDCRSTVNKPPLGREPSADFKRRILIAEHAPIRDIVIRWIWRKMPYWEAMHWKTHIWQSYATTQRTDRTGVDRTQKTQDAPVTLTCEANQQHLIDTARKRLCYQAAKETRKDMERLKAELHKVAPELSDTLVPNCVYRCGCPEMQSCGWFYRCSAEGQHNLYSLDIAARYEAYNKIFWEGRENA